MSDLETPDYMLEWLRELGFDLSEKNEDGDGYSVRCSQCVSLVTNGVPTHSRSCPNHPNHGN